MASYRIGWYSPGGMPSGIHRTIDDGVTTVCELPIKENIKSGHWKHLAITPTHGYGGRRFCRICYKNGGKAIEWHPDCQVETI